MSGFDWQQHLERNVKNDQMIQLVVSRPLTSTDVTKAVIHPLSLQGKPYFQWTVRRGPQEFHENLTPEEFLSRIRQTFGVIYGDLHWFAQDGDYTVRFKGPGQWTTKRKTPTKKVSAPLQHNRQRQYLIPEDRTCDFLMEVGIMLPDGRVKPTMYHKFRQLNRYLEFVNDVMDALPDEGPIGIVDFGCGKSYLTFALHYYFTRIRRREVNLVGLDRKRDVVRHCQEIANRLNCRGLSFQPGEIQSYQPSAPVHLAISLHACDTATDDAIATALQWQSRVIMAVPCCQHEIARMLPESTLPGLTEYGLLKDRFAAMATDALRARFLETRGYRTQVLEFIETEHTPKNILLRAVRGKGHGVDASLANRRFSQMKQELGIATFHLETAAAALENQGS